MALLKLKDKKARTDDSKLALSYLSCCSTSVKQKFFISMKLIQLDRVGVCQPPQIKHSLYSWAGGALMTGERFCST